MTVHSYLLSNGLLLCVVLQVYRHGGVDVLHKELRPILLSYPVDFPDEFHRTHGELSRGGGGKHLTRGFMLGPAGHGGWGC
jgi:hypothetical protein